MSYSGSMSFAISQITENTSSQVISGGLFERLLSSQHVFHNDSTLPALGGNCACIFSIALKSDGDSDFPTASVSISQSDTISARVGSQITSDSNSSNRLYSSTNPFITTRSTIGLSVSILDTGDLVYTNQANFLFLPIKG